jgi:uncharacterized membrane protein
MFLLPLLLGLVGGLRSLVAPAAVTLAARRGWLHLDHTVFSFMDSTAALAIFALLAVGELIADKLPSTPNRTKPAGLAARVVLGGLSGACVAASASHSIAVGAALGGCGGVVGAFAGYEARKRLTRALNVPDLAVALMEDGFAIAAALFIVSRS